MMLVKSLALWLVVACVALQLGEVNCKAGSVSHARSKGKGRGRKDSSSPKLPPPAPERNKSAPKPSSGQDVFRGKFLTKDKTLCTWVASGEVTFVLGVSCQNEGESFDCEYVAKPNACPLYTSKTKTFWKQIARSLQKQKRLCRDEAALVRAGMCRKAPKDAHFKLRRVPSGKALTQPTQAVQSENKRCDVLESRQKIAKEYCSDSWSSICTFFFSMVESEDC